MYNYFNHKNIAKGVLLALFLFSFAYAQPVPAPSTPLNGSTVYYNSPLISWYFNESSIGLTYQLQVSVVSNFSSLVLDTANLTYTSYIFDAESGTQYYWRVRSFRGASASAWTTPFTFTITGTAPTYTINSSAGIHGSINPAGTVLAAKHSSKTFALSPDSLYHVKRVIVDGISMGPLNSYTFTNITDNHTIRAEFSNLWFITASAGPHGRITPSGTDSVADHANISYSIIPDPYYHISAVKIDDSLLGTPSTVNITNVTAHHTITAEFARNSYTITATTSIGGSINPLGVSTVYYGDTVSYSIAPNPGYKIGYVIVDGVYKGKINSYTFQNVNASHIINAYFLPSNTYYVSNSGSDITGNGSYAAPFKTIVHAVSVCSPYGDNIIVGDGSYIEGVLISLPNITISGSGNTFIAGINISADSVKISKINIVQMPVSTDAGIIIADGVKAATIDSVNISGLNFGIRGNLNQGVSVLNSSFSNLNMLGLGFSNSSNLTISGCSASNNRGGGILLKNIRNFNVENTVCNSNNVMSPSLGLYSAGLVVFNCADGNITNLTANSNYLSGLYIGLSNSIKLDGAVCSNNYYFGIFINSDLTISDMLPGFSSTEAFYSVSNLKVEGNVTLRTNGYSGITLVANTPYNIIAPVFDGKITVNDSLIPSGYSAVSVIGNVQNPVFKGFKVKYSNPAFTIIGASGDLYQPSGVKINNCVFYQPVGVPVIQLSGSFIVGSGTGRNRVDARYNNFLMAASMADIESMILDSLDTPSLGRVDVSGSTFGAVPFITVESKPNAYKGASYYLKVDLKVTDVDYYWLRGSFTYDTTMIQYLGSLNNGMINNATWYLDINESPRGRINFTAYGFNPINTSGSLFMLNMKVLAGAPGASATINGSVSDFYGNLTQGVFAIIPGVINYTAPTGVIQSRGDVTLDGIVNDYDFYALLMHVNGVTLLTDPQALLNADFDQNGVVNRDDANALYAFLHPSTSPAPTIAQGSVTFNNVKYNKDGSATIPVSIASALNIRSFELSLSYDASKIDYQAFSSSVEAPGYFVQAFKTGEGKAKFVFNAQNSIDGNFYSGDVTLKFRDASVPVGSIISTSYIFNGKGEQKGPALKLGADGVTSVTEEASIIPDGYTLYQNYPNPFNPSTTIKYYLSEASDVTVTVYDMMGKTVKQLVASYQPKGMHSVVWNSENGDMKKVANGVYFYRIKAGSFTSVKKMILLK
jgi:hypothetical protein